MIPPPAVREVPSEGVGVPRHAAEQVARIAAYLLLPPFSGLSATSNGLTVTFRGQLSSSSPGELNLWLGHVLLLCPAALLIGYGFATALGPVVRRIATAIRGMSARERRLGVLALTLLAFAIARLGRELFLFRLPITDDAYAVEFG